MPEFGTGAVAYSSRALGTGLSNERVLVLRHHNRPAASGHEVTRQVHARPLQTRVGLAGVLCFL